MELYRWNILAWKWIYIVIPILDGHSGSDTNFTSIESNALEIINFINKNYNGKVKLIGGLSFFIRNII